MPDIAMDSTDLKRYVKKYQIDAEMVNLAVDTPTVEAAAAAVGVLPEQIGKSLLFLVDGDPVLIIANGMTRVDYRAMSKYFNVSRKRIKMANPDQVLQYTGYLVGTVPPFGHITVLSTVIENSVLEQEEIYAGGGEINVLVRVSTKELVRVVGARSAEFRRIYIDD
jgi:Cys-tRNA(Pro) deacylase